MIDINDIKKRTKIAIEADNKQYYYYLEQQKNRVASYIKETADRGQYGGIITFEERWKERILPDICKWLKEEGFDSKADPINPIITVYWTE